LLLSSWFFIWRYASPPTLFYEKHKSLIDFGYQVQCQGKENNLEFPTTDTQLCGCFLLIHFSFLYARSPPNNWCSFLLKKWCYNKLVFFCLFVVLELCIILTWEVLCLLFHDEFMLLTTRYHILFHNSWKCSMNVTSEYLLLCWCLMLMQHFDWIIAPWALAASQKSWRLFDVMFL
jgi:hypothetical protein